MRPVTRRQFVKTLGAAVGSATLLPSFGHTALRGTKLHILRSASFNVVENTWFKQTLSKQWAEPNGVDLLVELLPDNEIQAKASVLLESGTGPDIIGLLNNSPHLYSSKLRDVSAIAEKQGTDAGGYWEVARANCLAGSSWKSVPFNIGVNAIHYRTDFLKEVGETKFPDTLDEYNRVGKLMKRRGTPTGQAAGHSTGDPNSWFYPLLWMFGGAEVDQTGKKVAINSKETLAAVEFGVQWFQDSLTPEMLGWDDSSNNKAYLAGMVWATSNAASVLVAAKRDFPDIAKNTALAPNPKGPKGSCHFGTVYSHAIPTYVKDPKPAEELLKWIADPKNYATWLDMGEIVYAPAVKGYLNHPSWAKDPRSTAFKDASVYRWTGYPAPASPAASEALSKYLIVDMFAKAMQGMKPQDAVNWAEQQFKGIYEKA